MMMFTIISVWAEKTFQAVLPWGACCQGNHLLLWIWMMSRIKILDGSLSEVRYGAPYDGDNAGGDEK